MLIFDIESHTVGPKPNPDKDIFKCIGLYEYETNEYHVLSYKDKDKILEIFKRHRVVIGFNSKYFDEPIMKRCGFWKYQHCHIDLREVIQKRQAFLGCKDQSLSLDNLAKVFKLSSSKLTIDYDIFKQDNWTEEEWNKIVEYTKEDVVVTKEMFDHVNNYFEPFKEFVSDYDRYNYKWLTSAISVYAYKVLCNFAGLREEYADNIEHKTYGGGFVAFPSTDYVEGNIYCLDFNSLYPHIMIQGNLYSHNCKCCTEEEKWKGNDLFKIEGSYCTKKHSKIEDAIQKIYNKRVELKKQGSTLEYALKIVINTIYGLLGNPLFKQLYNHTSASDCTLIGRESTKYARRIFKDAGYQIIYSDTDSVYLLDTHDNEEILMKIKDKIIKHIQNNLPFQTDTFDMGVDERIKKMWFFKSGDTYKKKHYMYVDDKNKLKIKGLGMIKSDGSKLGYEIFKKYMRDVLIKENKKFDYNEVKKWVYDEIDRDISQITRKYKVWDVETYKSEGQLQAQISKKYGSGTHYLVPNKYVGVGKSIKYCTIDEFRSQNLSSHAIILNKLWKELTPFLNYSPHDVKINDKRKGQEELLRWTNIT